MRKKIFVFCLSLFLFMTQGIVIAEEKTDLEHIKNGDFEMLGADLMPVGWTSKNGAINEGILIETNDTASGEGNALKIAPQGKAVYVSQPVKTLIPGEEYIFTAKLRILENEDNKSAVKFEFTDAADESFWLRFSKSDAAKWTEITHTFTYPEKATRLSVMLRNTSTAGEILWDDISICGKGVEEEVAQSVKLQSAPEDIYVEKPSFAEEILSYASMESTDGDDVFKIWGPSSKELIKEETETVRTGDKSIKITWASGNPYIKQRVENVSPGATYQASFWYKIESTGTVKPGFKIEWYKYGEDGADSYINGVWVKEAPVQVKTEDWHRYTMHFTVPKDCEFLVYYIRLYTEGVCYFDDASLYMIEKAPVYASELSTDQVFYYSDMERGEAVARANLKDFPSTTAISFALSDASGILAEEVVPIDDADCASFSFDVSLLTESKEGEEPKAHIVSATSLNAEGESLGRVEQSVLRYPRPALIQKDGNIVLENGEPFYPVFAYHVKSKDLSRAGEVGINTVKSYGANASALKEYLDEADKFNIKVLVSLYPGMKPAGHPDNIENTKEVITKLKDHPALLAWMVMDEVFSYFPDRTDLLYDSYTLIRKLDMKHPVYMLQNSTSQFETIAKYTDILAFDPYPSVKENLAQTVAEDTQVAVEATAFQKPVWCLNKAYTLTAAPNEKERPLPTITEERNLWYQSLLAGAQAVGFFAFSDSIQDPETPLYDTTLWDGLCEFSKAEMEESYRYFIRGEYPVFANGRDDAVWYSAYIKDGKLRVIVLNRNEISTDVSVPLTSDDGEVKLSAFRANCIYGDGDAIVGERTLSLTLAPSAVYVYEVIPESPADYSTLSATRFRDLLLYPWAANAIRNLESEGKVYGTTPVSYAPAQKITRGDFAAFLVNTLGLTAETNDTFADVKDSYSFAKEIRTGKALGILKGVGDNAFNPFAEISRQDMMVICARGMRLVRAFEAGEDTAVLSSFSDESLIADYAVLDVAAMIRSSIILGNADGTINPMGNATRAETAVIMQRILAWKNAY